MRSAVELRTCACGNTRPRRRFCFGLCPACYMRARAAGLFPPRKPTAQQRFWAHVTKTPECWVWTGRLSKWGYGRLSDDRGVTVGVHCFAYELLVGPIPAGLQIDHLCKNPACVNPDHLEPVTRRENLLRADTFSGLNARKTACVHGHAFTFENTAVGPSGRRNCRACKREEFHRRSRRRTAVEVPPKPAARAADAIRADTRPGKEER